MLWIEKYRPKELEGILGEEHIKIQLRQFADMGSFPHLLLSGPRGTGKTTALDCFLSLIYGDYSTENVTVISSGTLFSQGRAYLESHPKFTPLYQKGQSVLSNFKHIVRWHASLKPLNRDFRVIVFDCADALPQDAQNGLRRTMERFSATCRFIFVTTQPAAIIDPIRSRTLPLSFLPIESSLITSRMREILASEGKSGAIPDEDLELLAIAVRGDLRKAIMHLQVAVELGTPINPESIDDTEISRFGDAIVDAVRRGDPGTARKTAESLMIEYGLSGRELIGVLHRSLRICCTNPEATILLAEADSNLGISGNEYLQINAFLASLEELKI
ncbi:AAA family ATPase [Methanocalculus taiwanensis]|uniref:Replication factor C small subunit n=1 Tax=Methanocalculus taiwanensis TaxID=106207 RepID=A0ABD4TJL5_9EURY|nr:AAA family ATPase [Methanocalculus taiwanensis]MCQ1538971.1 AAA family ATPase [Methanocalculus taiwanensis]